MNECDKCHNTFRMYRITKCGLKLCECCYICHVNGKCSMCSPVGDAQLNNQMLVVLNNLKSNSFGLN